MQTLIIGTRGSRLALAQTELVAAALRQAHPALAVTVRTIRTRGDRITDVPLGQVGGKGIFVKEIEEALLRGEADLAVHSAKDLPTELPAGLAIVAVPPREDPHDVLIARQPGATLGDLPPGATIGTSSVRRQAQLAAARPDLRFCDLRGNVDTRLRKLHEGGLDAIVLAAAGLRRLGLGELGWPVPFEICVPAPGQGLLALEARADDAKVAELLQPLEAAEARAALTAERAALAGLGGGCQVPVGIVAEHDSGELYLLGAVLSPDGTWAARAGVRGSYSEPEAAGAALAEALLAQGAGTVTGLAADPG